MRDSCIRWGAKWIQRGKWADEHIMFENRLPVIFRTRKEAREWIDRRYGYIRERKDLHSEPHCWRMPVAVRVKVEIAE